MGLKLWLNRFKFFPYKAQTNIIVYLQARILLNINVSDYIPTLSKLFWHPVKQIFSINSNPDELQRYLKKLLNKISWKYLFRRPLSLHPPVTWESTWNNK